MRYENDPTMDRARRVLVVEDVDVIRLLNKLGLERLGFRVDEAACCKVAFALLSDTSRAYAAVVLDLSLPDGNGAEIAHSVARTRPSAAIIVASGSPPEGLPPNILTCPKPYVATKLAELVRTAVDHADGVASP